MIEFQISAPGRVLLSGEHAMYYGKQVVAASLNLRTTLSFCEIPLEISRQIITIIFPDVDMYRLDIPLQIITNFIYDRHFHLRVNNYPLFFRHVQYFINSNCLWKTFEQKFSLEIFFFLLWVIVHNEQLIIQPFQVLLSTEIKMKAGLGSSTSFATCIAACFLHWSCLQRGDHSGFTPEKLKRIATYVKFFEKMMSEFQQDYIVCTYGRVIAFRYRDPLNIQREIINTPEINIMLVDANICLDKNQQMQQLADMKYRYGNAVDVHLNKINALSEGIVQILRRMRDYRTNMDVRSLQSLYASLRANLSLNQDYICGLNLSHWHFNTIRSIAEIFGFKGKSTGVGASMAIIILPPTYYYSNFYQAKVSYFMKSLNENNFKSQIITTMSCTGVRLEGVHQNRT